jgi:hypothetical protein
LNGGTAPRTAKENSTEKDAVPIGLFSESRQADCRTRFALFVVNRYLLEWSVFTILI